MNVVPNAAFAIRGRCQSVLLSHVSSLVSTRRRSKWALHWIGRDVNLAA
jgi:hypothetical protein